MEDHHKAETVGYAGGFFLTLVLVPQLYKTYKLKKADEISGIFIFMSIITSILFLTYAILIESNPIIVSNIIVLIQNLLMLGLKIKYSYN
jgi:MtN3 and saliva related transmembrane protein